MVGTVPSDGTMSAQEVANFLSIHVNTVRKLYRQDNLPYIRIGRVIRFRRADVEAWLNAKVQTTN